MHGIQTIKQLNAQNSEAIRIMEAHGHDTADYPTKRVGGVDKDPHSGVQPWSKGALFPGVITRVENYEHGLPNTTFVAQYKDREQRGFVSYELAEAWIIGRKAEDSARRAALAAA